jgi:hypothetical protein
MRSPEELDAVDWASLTHAYGGAEDVPHLVRSLYSDDAEEVDEALYELYGNVLHQGSVYPASVEAVPFLAHAAVHAGCNSTPVGLRALRALSEIGATPEKLRPRLRHWAFSPRRLLVTHWPPDLPHSDDQLRDTSLEMLSR